MKFRTELPITDDSGSRFVPSLVSVMVFLSILATSSLDILNIALSEWSKGIKGSVTIQLPSLKDYERNKIRNERILKKLTENPNIISARELSSSEINDLLEPWIGNKDNSYTLPLPELIDLKVISDKSSDIDKIKAFILEIAPDAKVDEHRKWFEQLITLTEAFLVLTLGITILIVGTLALTIINATRASLGEFKEIIEVLHIIGAHDSYVANQFAKRTFKSSFQGSILGFLGGLISVIVISWLAKNIQSGFLPELELDWTFWLLIPLISISASILSTVTAYLTVLTTIKKII